MAQQNFQEYDPLDDYARRTNSVSHSWLSIVFYWIIAFQKHSFRWNYTIFCIMLFVSYGVNSIFSNDSHLFTKLSTCVKSLWMCVFPTFQTDVHSDTTLCCIFGDNFTGRGIVIERTKIKPTDIKDINTFIFWKNFLQSNLLHD